MALVEREGPSQNIVKYRPVDTKLANNWLGSVSHSALPLIFIPKPTPDVRTIFATLHWENNRFTTHSDSWSQGGSSPFYLHHENHQAKWFLLALSVVNNILPARILCPTQMEWRKTPRHSSAVLFIVWNISDVIPARSDKIKPRRPYKLEVSKGLREEISQCPARAFTRIYSKNLFKHSRESLFRSALKRLRTSHLPLLMSFHSMLQAVRSPFYSFR